MGSREEEYLETAGRYSRDELSDISQGLALLVQEMERYLFTHLLGPFYLECAAHSSKQARGEFYNLPEISKLMARMLFDVDSTKAERKPITLRESACGSGGMVLAVGELFFAPDAVDLLRVTAQDINPVAADMAYINLTLWGIPARIILGDTICNSVNREWMNVRLSQRTDLLENVSSEERHSIAAQRGTYIKVAGIASNLNRHRSTIYRELKRNASTGMLPKNWSMIYESPGA